MFCKNIKVSLYYQFDCVYNYLGDRRASVLSAWRAFLALINWCKRSIPESRLCNLMDLVGGEGEWENPWVLTFIGFYFLSTQQKPRSSTILSLPWWTVFPETEDQNIAICCLRGSPNSSCKKHNRVRTRIPYSSVLTSSF